MLRPEGSRSGRSPVCCVRLVFIISKSVFVELACFCSTRTSCFSNMWKIMKMALITGMTFFFCHSFPPKDVWNPQRMVR